jgi:hypothetical protein
LKKFYRIRSRSIRHDIIKSLNFRCLPLTKFFAEFRLIRNNGREEEEYADTPARESCPWAER